MRPLAQDHNRRLDLLSAVAVASGILAAPASLAAVTGTTMTSERGERTTSSSPITAASQGLPVYDGPLNDIAWRADLDQSGVVDFGDLQLFIAAWSEYGSGASGIDADINMDGSVTFADLNIILALFNMAVVAPEVPAGAPVLLPGDGFSGLIVEPEPAGNPGVPGFDAKAIARWDVVPFQDFSGAFQVGVVAFHMSGIDRVEFSADGGPWVAVTEMSENPRTGVWEYWVSLNAEDFGPGQVEVRAVVYPNAGEPRVLQGPSILRRTTPADGEYSMYLNANPGGAMPNSGAVTWVATDGNDSSGNGSEQRPYATIRRALETFRLQNGSVDRLTVYLKPGTHLPAAGDVHINTTWVTIEPAPGVDRSEVIIAGRLLRPKIDLLRYHNVTIELRMDSLPVHEGFVDFNRKMWLDDVDVVGVQQHTGLQRLAGRFDLFVTDSTFRHQATGPVYAPFVRNTDVLDTISDSFQNNPFIVSSRVSGLDRGEFETVHPDVFQVHMPQGAVENWIIYGLEVTDTRSQGLFVPNPGGGFHNVAIVNLLMSIDTSINHWQTQWSAVADHVVIQHSSFLGHTVRWMPSAAPHRNFVVNGSIFEKMITTNAQGQATDPDAIIGTIQFRDNHYIDATTYAAVAAGQNYTTGDPLFLDVQSNNFRPGLLSPLRDRIMGEPGGSDLSGEPRHSPAAVGPLESAG